VGFVPYSVGYGSRDEGERVPKLVWRVKLVAEFETGEATEVEVAQFERDEQAGLADLGLRLAEAKRLTAAIQAEIVPAQVMIAGESRSTCVACGRVLASKGHYTATFRSLFGDVPIRVRRLLACPCQGVGEAKSFAAFDLEAATVAPELAYVTARYAALAPFGKVADLLSELLPVGGAANAGTVRNRTMRAGEAVVLPHVTTTAEPATATAQPSKPVVVGLDGGYVRGRHRQDERHFEVIAGKVIDAEGNHSRFAFARNSPAIASGAFKQALAVAGVTADTPATVLCDGDTGLWRLQREALPNATIVLDWWHVAVRFEHALQTARGLAAGDAKLAAEAVRGLERAKWRLWHGRWPGCRRKLAALCRGARRRSILGIAAIGRLEHHAGELLAYLERNQGALVHYAARRRNGEPISTAFVESSVNEIIAKRMNKKQQMRWNRATVQPFLDVRTAVLNDTLEDAFRHCYPGFHPANGNEAAALAS
jgi:hypothetical protein